MSAFSFPPGVPCPLADRTTRRDGHPAPPDGLSDHLRVVIARVLRTGRGPAHLVAWVGGLHRPAAHPGGGAAVEHLADELVRRLHPAAAPATVGG